MTFRVEKNVSGLDVAMDFLAQVKIFKTCNRNQQEDKFQCLLLKALTTISLISQPQNNLQLHTVFCFIFIFDPS